MKRIDGITLLAMARDKKLKSHTILKTHHESEYFDDLRKYDYYIYFEDNQFHRCDENGKLGAKYQNRFLNYEVLKKEFEIIEERPKEIEEFVKTDVVYEAFEDGSKIKIEKKYDYTNEEIYEKLNEVIRGFNYLLKKEDDKKC